MKCERVLVKLSGGAVAGERDFGFDHESLEHLVDELLSVAESGVALSVVIGGGNIFKGQTAEVWGIDRVEADNIGVLGTVINSLMLRGALKSKTDREVRVMTAIPIASVAEPYIRLKALQHLERGFIVILAGGNGQPYVTTDYPAVQRALELKCDAMLFAKNGVDGVFDKDPNQHMDAELYERLSYGEAIAKNLRVMDSSAFILARDHALPLHVFNASKRGAMRRILEGRKEGTYVHL